jgi:hypothetical protein
MNYIAEGGKELVLSAGTKFNRKTVPKNRPEQRDGKIC